MFAQVDAIEFYGNKEKDLRQKMREQLEKGPPRPLGMAFVTFRTNAMAKLWVAICLCICLYSQVGGTATTLEIIMYLSTTTLV